MRRIACQRHPASVVVPWDNPPVRTCISRDSSVIFHPHARRPPWLYPFLSTFFEALNPSGVSVLPF